MLTCHWLAAWVSPTSESEKAEAEYRDGVLAVFIPRAESEKPRTIKIK